MLAVAVAIIGAACGPEPSDGAADGLSSSGGSLGTAGAHEHGVARVNVAVEGDGAAIEFFAPGQSIYGFEGVPRGAEQEAARQAAIERLKQELPRMFAFDPSLGCRFGSPRVEVEDEGHGEGEHDDKGDDHAAGEAGEAGEDPHDAHPEARAGEHEPDERPAATEPDHAAHDGQHDEVHAEVEVQCARSLAGTDLRLAVTESFPEIVQVDLQVLSEAQQTGVRVAAHGHTVRL